MSSNLSTAEGSAPARRTATLVRPRSLRRVTTPWLLLAPAAVVMIAVIGYPWAWSLWVSFMRWSATSTAGPTAAGLANYRWVLTSGEFWHSVALTAILVGISVPAELLLGFGLASLINSDLRGMRLLQGVYLLPMMVVPVMAGLSWRIMFHPQYGVLTYLQDKAGLPAIGWLTDPHVAIVTATIVEVWRHTPFAMLILMAGLSSVPTEILDAAKVDGASRLQTIRYVVLGHIRPFVLFAAITVTMFELRSFDIVYGIFQSKGPGDGASVLGMYLFETFSNTLDFGKSSAVAFILLTLTLFVTAPMVHGAFRKADE